MRSGRGRRRFGLACATAAMALTGCGAASDEERERSDGERARAALLTQGDLPGEWRRSDSGAEEAAPSPEQLARLCPGYPAAWLVSGGDEVASFESDGGVIAHGITTVADGADAGAQFDDFGSARSRRCMRGIVEWSLREADVGDAEIEVGDVEVEALDRAGDERGMHLSLTLGVGDVTLPVEGDVVATRAVDTFSSLYLLSLQQPLDAALRDRLAEIAAQRLRQQFG